MMRRHPILIDLKTGQAHTTPAGRRLIQTMTGRAISKDPVRLAQQLSDAETYALLLDSRELVGKTTQREPKPTNTRED